MLHSDLSVVASSIGWTVRRLVCFLRLCRCLRVSRLVKFGQCIQQIQVKNRHRLASQVPDIFANFWRIKIKTFSRVLFWLKHLCFQSYTHFCIIAPPSVECLSSAALSRVSTWFVPRLFNIQPNVFKCHRHIHTSVLISKGLFNTTSKVRWILQSVSVQSYQCINTANQWLAGDSILLNC